MPYKIGIHTAQNVVIEYEVANVWDRCVALIVDVLIMGAYVFFVTLLVTSLIQSFEDTILTIVIFIIYLPVITYSLLFEVFNNGQSPGKLVMNIQVVSMGGEPVTLGQYLIRWLFRIVDLYIISFIVAVLVIVFSEKGQRVGDLVAGTTVITKKKRKNLQSTVYERTETSHKPTYPEVTKLDSKQIQIIKNVLANREENRFELITELARKVESTLGVTKSSSSETFLKIVVKDFNHYNSQE